MTDTQDRIQRALKSSLLTQEHIERLTQNLQLGRHRVTQDELTPVLVWAVEVLASTQLYLAVLEQQGRTHVEEGNVIVEDAQLLGAALDSRLLLGVENGKVVFRDPRDIAQ